ncbi:MAG: DNA-binding NarL/FixJ family response regulator [Halieaceae bacterium]|jgi:DNA-binding NarL/FixJ family response regulator
MRVLLVDDHSLIRTGIRDSLSKHYPSVIVTEAGSGKAALDLAAHQSFDLALMDLFIPGEKLFQLIKQICNDNVDLPVIVLTSSEHPAHIRRCIDLGAVGYVSKSSSQTTLFEAIDLVLAGGIYLPAAILDQPEGTGQADPLAMSYMDVNRLLTSRQMDILTLIAQGQTNKEMARHLQLSVDTVKVHVSAVLKGLGMTNRTQIAILGEKLGLKPQGLS